MNTLRIASALVIMILSNSYVNAATIKNIDGVAAQFFWSELHGPKKLLKMKTKSPVAFQKIDFAIYFKQESNVICYQRVDLNDPNVISYSCEIEE